MGVTHKVRGADCTVPSNEMARVDRWRKLLVNIVIGVILDGNLYLGIWQKWVGWSKCSLLRR